MIETLTLESFAPHLNTEFVISGDGESDTLTLVECSAGREDERFGQAFTLVFHGARADIVFSSHMQTLTHPEMGAFELFISPFGRNEDGTYKYQAVFN
jgi:hypothetical protein